MTNVVKRSGAKLTPADRRELVHALATAEVKRIDLARQYGVTPAYITKFAHQHQDEIDAVRGKLDDAYVGKWIADKESRVAAYQDEFERLDEHKNADHFEWSKARQSALHAVAEELGQLPPRQTTVVMPVTHVVVGVDTEALK